MEFLRSFVEPWSAVENAWKLTADIRITILRHDNSLEIKVCDYFNKYPCLKQPSGYMLVKIFKKTLLIKISFVCKKNIILH